MTAPARHRHLEDEYEPFATGETHGVLLPGERVGPPLPGRGRALVRGGLLILLGLGGGWAVLTERVTLPDWASVEAKVAAWMRSAAPEPAERASLAMAPASGRKPAADPLPPPPPVVEVPARSPLAAVRGEEARPSAPAATAALPPPAPDREEAQAGPLPPPVSDPADPYRKRAEAVGLHPDLSRVLLDRMTPADYRNARYAIDTALARTADTEAFVWPRQRKPDEALFRVHFVKGAAPGCRRYVVSITKDGWLTTALPMERCGAEARRSARRE